MSWLCRIFAILLLAGASAAAAAQLVPPSDQAGRERYRFAPSPLDRFMQPNPPAKPLLRWDCEQEPGSSRAKPRSRRSPNC
jgi:hypothetical protein